MNKVLRTQRTTVNAAHNTTTKEQLLQTLGIDERTLLLAIEIAETRKGNATINAAKRVTAPDLEFAQPANILLSAESHERINQRKRQHSAHTFQTAVERALATNAGRFVASPAILLTNGK